MQKKILLFSALIVLLIVSGSFFWRDSAISEEKKIVVGGREFSVEIAADAASRQKGLGGREKLCLECGMLFVFEKIEKHSFWMKDMRFSLDILWIADKKVVFMAENVPLELLTKISPLVAADRVLEINAGLCAQYGIKVGTEVSY